MRAKDAIFTPDDIKRANTLARTLDDPYVYNALNRYAAPAVKSIGWTPKQGPSFTGSLGRSMAGLAAPILDPLRSFVGLSPGNGMIRNMASSVGQQIGGHIWNDPAMIASGKKLWNSGNWWANPYNRAAEQSQSWRGAFPSYLKSKPWGKYLTNPSQSLHEMAKSIPSSGD